MQLAVRRRAARSREDRGFMGRRFRSSFIVHRSSVGVYRSLFIVYRSSVGVYRSLFIGYRSSVDVYRSLFIVYRASVDGLGLSEFDSLGIGIFKVLDKVVGLSANCIGSFHHVVKFFFRYIIPVKCSIGL